MLQGDEIFAIDFDGTLVQDAFPNIGKTNIKLLTMLKELKKKYPKLRYILWTCRTDDYLENAVNWCKDHGLEIDYVNTNAPELIALYGGDTRKVFANIYIDDRAMLPEDFLALLGAEAGVPAC